MCVFPAGRSGIRWSGQRRRLGPMGAGSFFPLQKHSRSTALCLLFSMTWAGVRPDLIRLVCSFLRTHSTASFKSAHRSIDHRPREKDDLPRVDLSDLLLNSRRDLGRQISDGFADLSDRRAGGAEAKTSQARVAGFRPLLVPERFERVDPSSAANRDQARSERHDEESRRSCPER
jgi:hypothetical protein